MLFIVSWITEDVQKKKDDEYEKGDDDV